MFVIIVAAIELLADGWKVIGIADSSKMSQGGPKVESHE